MKVLSVAGYHHTGKTTVVVEIIKELRKRGYTVQSIKDIHSEKFTMEKPGSNSWKHWEASDNTVFARGISETYQIWHEHLPIKEMLKHLKADFVIVEGAKTSSLPRILCADSTEQLDELLNGTVFAISGKFGNDNSNYNNLPVFNIYEEISKLVDLVEKKVFEVLPFPKDECCGVCGLTCREMTEAILAGKRSREECKTDHNLDIQIKINDKEMIIVPYVQNTLKDVIVAFLKNLKGYEDGKIDIKINY